MRSEPSRPASVERSWRGGGSHLEAGDERLGADLGVDRPRDALAPDGHRPASLHGAGGRAHERAPAHPEQIGHARARQREQYGTRRERARRRVQTREIAQGAQAAEGALGAVERPHHHDDIALARAALEVLGLAEHEAAGEELGHHRRVRRLARKRPAERRGEVRRVLAVERVRLDVEVERLRLRPGEDEPRQDRAQAREQRLARGGRQRRRGPGDAFEWAPAGRVGGHSGRRGREQSRGEHADRPTRQRSARHRPQCTASTGA